MSTHAINVSVTDVRVEISRTNLTTDIRFDAITLEIPLDYLPHQRLTYNNTALEWIPVKETPTGNRVYDMLKYEDCSGNSCVVQLTEYDSSEAEHYIESGREDSMALLNRGIRGGIDRNPSNTSFIVVGVGKRIQGDEILTYQEMNYTSQTLVRLINARKVYSVTVGLLSWRTQDLVKVYGAGCVIVGNNTCMGLSFPLDATASEQHLLAGASRLPLRLLSPLYFTDYFYGVETFPTSLVTLPTTTSYKTVPTKANLVSPLTS
uniref:Uncharacterized protein n=1 Tax=Globisporangium ultimum (strain ATCC 200006 / CBS 805.95 / DAOM BR144) TaxID=431595 RepID=K3X018_GLOUD